MDEFALRIRGQEIVEWRQLYLYSSMCNIAGGFSGVLPSYKDGSDYKVKMGDACVGLINGVIVFTGYIDEIINSYGTNPYIKLSGRDKTADLVDCSFSETVNEWRNQKASAIIKNLCKPFSVDVVFDVSVSVEMAAIIKTFKADEGETPFEEITRLCRDLGVLAISYGDGRLTITKCTSNKYISDTILVGQNAENGVTVSSDRARFSKYIVKGQGIGLESSAVGDFVNPWAQATDSVIVRNRTLTVFTENTADIGKCKSRAFMEAYVRAGFSRTLSYRMRTFKQSDGKPWSINQLARIVDDIAGVKDTMLIVSVEFVSDETSQQANLLLVNKNTFLPSAKDNGIKLGYDT